MRYNEIRTLIGGAFYGLQKIREIKLSGNRIVHLNSDVFEDLPTLQKLDLSENFIQKFPTVALEAIENLKSLNISSNMIQVENNKNYCKSSVLLTIIFFNKNFSVSIVLILKC